MYSLPRGTNCATSKNRAATSKTTNHATKHATGYDGLATGDVSQRKTHGEKHDQTHTDR